VSTTSKSQAKLKALKRVIKLVVTGLVDLYPAKKDYLPSLAGLIKQFS
jgi:hypothetical protein